MPGQQEFYAKQVLPRMEQAAGRKVYVNRGLLRLITFNQEFHGGRLSFPPRAIVLMAERQMILRRPRRSVVQ